MSTVPRLAVLGLLGAGLAWQVIAQATTTATCITDQWTFNEEGDSPCLVAASLRAACNGGVFSMPALPPGLRYSGPFLGLSDVCACSTVTYSMVAACGICQEHTITTWPDWITNCTTNQISVSAYPLSIPAGTSVPAWAYLDVTVSGTWNPVAAEDAADQNAPDSSASVPIATSGPGSSSGGGSSSGSSHSSLNIPAIAGGAAGGVVGLLLIGLVIFLLVRRSKRNAARSPSADVIQGGVRGEKADLSPSTALPSPAPLPYYANGAGNGTPMQDAQKFYNPSDPSTFPTSATPPHSIPGSTSPHPPAQYGGGPPVAPYGGSPPPVPYGGQVPSTPSTQYGGRPPSVDRDEGIPSVPYSNPPPTQYASQPDPTPYGIPSPTSDSRPFSQVTFGGYGQPPAVHPPFVGQQQQAHGQGYKGTPEV